MSVLRFIARHELTRYRRDGHVRFLVLSMAFLLLASMVLSIRDSRIWQDQYRESLRQSRLNWESQTEKDPHDAAHDGTYAVKPLHPLGVLDRGIQPYAGKVVHLGAHERKQSTLQEVKDHEGLFRFGELTPNFVLLYLLPLLLLFMGHPAFTAEREGQTLRLICAHTTVSAGLVLGKWAALGLLMLLMYGLYLGLAIAGMAVLGQLGQVGWFDWTALSVAHLLYLSVFVHISILVSSLSGSSRVSLVVLLGFWIVLSLIVPKLSSNVAGRLYPFPTLQTFQENIIRDQQQGLDGHNFWNESAQVFKAQVLREYGVATIEELPVDFGGLLLAEGEKYESEIYTKHFDLLRSQYDRQRGLFRLGACLSPFLPVRFVSMALARTDYNFQWHFEDQAEEYRVAFNTALNMDIAEHAKGVTAYKADADLWARIPVFAYAWEPSGRIFIGHIYEYIALFFWSAISFLAMLFWGRRFRNI